MKLIIPVLDKIAIGALFVFVAFSMFSISITQVAGGIGGLAWFCRAQLTKTWKEQSWPLGISFSLYVLACLVAVADAYDVSYSFKPLKKLLEILIFFWVLNSVRNNKLRDLLVMVLIVSATLAGLFGFYQAWEDGVSVASRVEGTMSVYMTFAGLLMTVGMVAFGRALFRHPKESWLWFAIIVIIVCLLFTLTRQAWFGFIVGSAFLVYMWRKKYFVILSACIFSIIILATGPMKSQVQKILIPKDDTFIEQTKLRFLGIISGNDSTFDMRKALWMGGWEIYKDHPLTGCGFRCVDLVHPEYPDPTGYIKHLRGMHNNFVQLAVDTGFLGLSAWLGIWFCFFRLLYRKALALEGDPHKCWVIFGSVAAVLAFLSGGCFESNFYDSEVVMVLYFIMALPFSGSEYRKLHE